MSNPRLAFVLGLSLAAAVALAASPVGTWKGKIVVKVPPMPANVNPQQKAMMTQMLGQIAKAKIVANLKKDGTFTVKTSGMPGPKPSDTTNGKWTQKGNTVTMTESKPGEKPQNFILSPNGKTMTLALPGGQGQVIFTR